MEKYKKIKSKVLSKIYKGKNIIQYKRSYKHPLLNRTYFNPSIGFFIISKIWNVKRKDEVCWNNYEKDKSVSWYWKVEIITKSGKYVYPLEYLYALGLEENGKQVSDENAFIFYK